MVSMMHSLDEAVGSEEGDWELIGARVKKKRSF